MFQLPLLRFPLVPLGAAWCAVLLLGFASPLRADNENLLLGNPSAAAATDPHNRLVEHQAFSLGYDQSAGGAKWVSWHLAQSDRGRSGRSDDFRPDESLPAASQIRPTDYRGSGYDRGHLCPSGDRTANAELNSQTFLMSNMLPQTPDLNRQLWRKFEEYCRDQLKGGENELYILTGGVGSIERIGGGKVNVPASCWKVAVILPRGDDDLRRIDGTTRVVSILMPNETGPEIAEGKWSDYLTSVDKIEELTKLDLLSNLPQEVQAALEARIDTGRAPARRGEAAPAVAPAGVEAAEAQALTADEFKAITKQMTRAQVQALAGKPASVTGSGLYIEVYHLADKSSVLLGWTGPAPDAALVYVKHRGATGDTELLQAK